MATRPSSVALLGSGKERSSDNSDIGIPYGYIENSGIALGSPKVSNKLL